MFDLIWHLRQFLQLNNVNRFIYQIRKKNPFLFCVHRFLSLFHLNLNIIPQSLLNLSFQFHSVTTENAQKKRQHFTEIRFDQIMHNNIKRNKIRYFVCFVVLPSSEWTGKRNTKQKKIIYLDNINEISINICDFFSTTPTLSLFDNQQPSIYRFWLWMNLLFWACVCLFKGGVEKNVFLWNKKYEKPTNFL